MNNPDALPPEFDPDHYRATYADLRSMDDAEAAAHFTQYGCGEGREGSRMTQRGAFLADLMQRNSGDILEIGPFCSPVVTGPNVAYMDVFDAAELRSRAAAYGLDVSRVPVTIDYVGDISNVDRKFSAVVSSHSLEHQTDLVHHLSTIGKILQDGGYYYAIVPDKRYCFDALLPESTIGGVLQAHREGRTRHTLQSVIEHVAMMTHNDPVQHWNGNSGEVKPANQLERIHSAIAQFDEANGGYVDVHAWYLTPELFRNVADTLFDMGLSDLKPVRVYNTPRNGFEFCAVLEKITRQ